MTLWHEAQNAWTALGLVSRVALISWVLATMGLLAIRWIWGEKEIRWGVSAEVVLQATTVFAALWQSWGWKRATLSVAVILGMGWDGLSSTLGRQLAFSLGATATPTACSHR